MKIKSILCVVIGLVIVIGCISYLNIDDHKHAEQYNGGYCSKCGHEFYCTERFEKGDGEYITTFRCPQCGEHGYAYSRLIK